MSLLALFNLCDLNLGITKMPKQGAALSQACMTVTVALPDPIQSLILNFLCWLWKSKWIVNVRVRHWLCSKTRGEMIAVAIKWRHGDTSGQVKARWDRPCDHISADGSRCVQGNWLSRVCGGWLLLAPRNQQREVRPEMRSLDGKKIPQ